ncbi:hypothetical protein EJ05DRAFT_156499 [Pseudovirgaria hyperparasitica]|uniref:Uncharacterized protein n=1 Tax=Pseudovirgaria hyperparasitica TaxID=470096 RepID=A0A6A6VUH3_9PEZI|nr:uncharacterized protein EJ05DRAFT_156499 [Pseudovirgaria hyperparasitica]KAF2754338.1 hypothetical protein EJ05DRAFT_156499 [Pseudovirgaria hyperparasitica]
MRLFSPGMCTWFVEITIAGVLLRGIILGAAPHASPWYWRLRRQGNRETRQQGNNAEHMKPSLHISFVRQKLGWVPSRRVWGQKIQAFALLMENRLRSSQINMYRGWSSTLARSE